LSKCVVLSRHDFALLVLLLLLVELFFLLLRPKVLFWWVVRFVVIRENEFGSRHMHGMRNVGSVGSSPESVEARSFGNFDGSRSSRYDAAGSNRSNDFHHLLVLPFRGKESRFGLGTTG
jgi:hypothetical protein